MTLELTDHFNASDLRQLLKNVGCRYQKEQRDPYLGKKVTHKKSIENSLQTVVLPNTDHLVPFIMATKGVDTSLFWLKSFVVPHLDQSEFDWLIFIYLIGMGEKK